MEKNLDTLILRLEHYDGAQGEIVRAWLSGLYVSTIAHGWALGRDIRAPDNMARAESILRSLEDHGLISRIKQDLSYAPEIRFFGVGGFPGSRVEKSDSPLLCTFAPTDLLNSFVRSIRNA